MGDTLRFKLFAKLIERNFPNKNLSIADVAGGKGHLQAELRQLGYTNIISWDKRKKCAGVRQNLYKYGYFVYDAAPTSYDLVVGMHPDEGTDQIIGYANLHRVPFVVCPCCVKPSAFKFHGKDYRSWLSHLRHLSKAKLTETALPMRGKSDILMGRY